MNAKAIKRWAVTREITWVMVAGAAGVSRQQVCNVINGRRTDTNEAVRKALIELGCPQKHLQASR